MAVGVQASITAHSQLALSQPFKVTTDTFG